MTRCISCNKSEGVYFHHDGGRVCGKCLGSYFTCPDCGEIFDNDDRVNGDQGNGFCKNCHKDH